MAEYIQSYNGMVDDVALKATEVRIEDLGDRIWIAVYRPDGDRFTFEIGPEGVLRMVEFSVGSGDIKFIDR